MAFIDPTDLTWEGELVKSKSEAIYEQVFKKPAIELFHSVETGIKAKKQIAFLGKLGLIGRKQSDCQMTENSGGIPMSEKFWDPEYIGDRFVECWSTLKESFWIWGLKNGIDKADLTSTDFANFIEDRLADAMQEMVFRLAWFGDKDAANYNDSPAGLIKNGVDTAFFNPIDGLWKQLFAIGTGDANRRVTISKNSGNSYVDQTFNDVDTGNKVAEKIFEGLKYGADFRLRDMPNLVIIATQSLVDQYAKELRSRNIDASFERIEGGYTSLKFEGIDIIPFNFWDRTIRAYFDNGTKYHLPHRAVMTVKENIKIGTEEAGNLSEFKPFYDQREKEYLVDFGFNMDAKVIEDYLVQVAY